MTNQDTMSIDEQIDNILLEHIVLATDNGQPYIKSTDTAVEAIKQLINQARIDMLKTFMAFEEKQPGTIDWDFLDGQLTSLELRGNK